MPTKIGKETIGERLKRLRADLERVRAVIARSENNGSMVSMGGVSTTEIAIERAEAKAVKLEQQISALEARLTGSADRPGLALLQTKFD